MGKATPEPFASARANRSALGLLLAVVLAVGLVSLPSEVYHGDPSAVRMEAAFLVAEKGLGIPDDVVDTRSYRQLKRNGYFARNQATGRWYSRYGLANTLLAVPPLLVEHALHGALIPGLVHSDTLPLVLGLYNLPFALGIAWLLWQILSLYTENAAAKLFFVLSTLYATFLWNYLRAHNSEIHQLFFYLGFHLHLLRYLHRRGRGPVELTFAMGFLAALCLTKLIYVLLIPIACVAAPFSRLETLRGRWRELPRELLQNARTYALFLLLPAALVAVIAAGVNSYKFGSPISTGYVMNVGGKAVPEDFFEGFRGFLIGPQRSVFLHFPLLLLAGLGLRPFARRHAFDLVLCGVIFGVFFLVISLFYWTWGGDWAGEWCYGPRYLLFALPLVSLPFLEVLRGIRLPPRSLGTALTALVVALVLGYSVQQQLRVNALGFFTFYRARDVLMRLDHPQIGAYFRTRPFPWINADWITSRTGGPAFPPLEYAKDKAGPKGHRALERELEKRIHDNYWLTRSRSRPSAEGEGRGDSG